MPILSGGKYYPRKKVRLKATVKPRKKKKRVAPKRKKIVVTGAAIRPESKYIWILYELELEDGFRYVGIATDVERRFDEHFLGKGARWTRVHKPIDIAYTEVLGHMTNTQASVLETNYTLKIMDKYGYENVRGGKFCAVDSRVHKRMCHKFG